MDFVRLPRRVEDKALRLLSRDMELDDPWEQMMNLNQHETRERVCTTHSLPKQK